MNKWDVVLIGYPFSNHQASKVRPAVVISPNDYNGSDDDILVLLVTSNIARKAPYDVVVTKDHPEFRQSGFRVDSAIRVSKMMTLAKTNVRHLLGRLGAVLVAEVEHELRDFLGLPQ